MTEFASQGRVMVDVRVKRERVRGAAHVMQIKF